MLCSLCLFLRIQHFLSLVDAKMIVLIEARRMSLIAYNRRRLTEMHTTLIVSHKQVCTASHRRCRVQVRRADARRAVRWTRVDPQEIVGT